MILPSDLPACYKTLSLKLYQVMEHIGFTVEMRDLRMEVRTCREILYTIAYQPAFSVYHFGSSIEGTGIAGPKSDVDSVFINNELPVITECSDASHGKTLLLIQDSNTQAGYAKLQIVYNGIQLFAYNVPTKKNMKSLYTSAFLSPRIDKMNRLVCSYIPPDLPDAARHGPALSSPAGHQIIAKDLVYALNSKKWPDCAAEWLTRQRDYGWPASDLLDKCKSLGCILVPVGHPKSEEYDLQWRVSFSHQEKLLVTQFTSVQLKCYILLKMIKKDILYHFIGRESLSSYHCKTCMFYMIENTPRDFWKPENLLACLLACINTLRSWVDSGVCPNYFIPSENMFERNIYGELQKNLSLSLHHISSADCGFLLHIRSDDLGQLMAFSQTSLGNMPTRHYDHVELFKQSSLMDNLSKISLCRNFSLRDRVTYNLERTIANLHDLVKTLKTTSKITEHTEKETQRAVSVLLPYLELSLTSNLITMAIGQSLGDAEIWRLVSSNKWRELSYQSEPFSPRLKQAAIMYSLGYYQAAAAVLTPLLNKKDYSNCSCDRSFSVFSDVGPICKLTKSAAQEPTKRGAHVNQEPIKDMFTPCVVFLPTETDVTPTAICGEMIRSLGMPPGSRDEGLDYWYDWAIVDGQFLLHFLLYLNHSKLNMASLAAADIDNMEHVINTRNISHRETCLNLLGLVYEEEGCDERAVECYEKSLEIKPEHNAAFWHLLIV